jgi:hypothetical protein
MPLGGVRAIVSKGWSARMSKGGDDDVAFPEECYSVRFVISVTVPITKVYS